MPNDLIHCDQGYTRCAAVDGFYHEARRKLNTDSHNGIITLKVEGAICLFCPQIFTVYNLCSDFELPQKCHNAKIMFSTSVPQ